MADAEFDQRKNIRRNAATTTRDEFYKFFYLIIVEQAETFRRITERSGVSEKVVARSINIKYKNL